MKSYYITDEHDNIDPKIYKWLEEHLDNSQYCIENTGFLIDAYYLHFTDSKAETLYLLKWA